MEFRPTNPKPKRAGFTVPELLVGTALSGLILVGAASFFLFSVRSFASMANYTDLNNRDRNASDLLSRDIRSASSVQSATANQIVLSIPNGNVSYTYYAGARSLSRTDRSGTRTLLTGVDSFSFSLYQRPATNSLYSLFSTAAAANAKMVGFQWSCSRSLAGIKLDSESLQTAMVELRNQ